MVVSRVQQCIVTIMVRATVSGLAERSLARNGSICFLGNSFCGLKEGYSLCVRVITGKLCGIDECRVAFAQVWHTVYHTATVWHSVAQVWPESLSPGKCDAPTMARRPQPLRGISIIFCCTSRSTKPTGFVQKQLL